MFAELRRSDIFVEMKAEIEPRPRKDLEKGGTLNSDGMKKIIEKELLH
jgi:hypothetical protein